MDRKPERARKRRRPSRKRTGEPRGGGDCADLARAAEGLTYPSETDAPFDPVLWHGHPAPEAVAAADAEARGGDVGPVERVPVGDFFAELEGTSEAERFAALRKAMEAMLSDLRVLRVGARKVHVYVVGRHPAGSAWAGLHTVSVET